MDRLESLGSTLSNITLYDIKSMYNQAKNVVLNVSEMEAKVREATNDDPWGASSTLMQEIAQGTFHFQHFNEIMPAIYSRFMEKEANQWRQIYKALQLMEYLVKHGSERVVDDARSHISTLKMLRNFHYIDEKGKDEGINVRNRAKELVELLSDVEKIRTERRKAKVNKSKYIGVGNDGWSGGGGMSFESGGSRYGGFGNDTLSSGSGSYGGGYEGSSSSRTGGSTSFRDNNTSRRNFEEYSAGDDEISHPAVPNRSNSLRTPTRKASAPPPPPEPVVDLLGGFDDPVPAPSSAGLATNKALPVVNNPAVSIDDDDFGDLQAAPVQNSITAAPPVTAGKPNLMDLLNSTPTTAARPPMTTGFSQPQYTQQPQQMGFGMNMGMGMGGHRQTPSLSGSFSTPLTAQPMPPAMQPQSFSTGAAPLKVGQVNNGTLGGGIRPQSAASSVTPAKATANFDDLWSLSLGSTSKPANVSGPSKSIKDLEKEKANAGLWGGQQRPPAAASQMSAFNTFGNAAPPSSSSANDDLLF